MKTRSLYLLTVVGGMAWFLLASPQPTSGQYAAPAGASVRETAPGQSALPQALPQAPPRTTAAVAQDSDMSPLVQTLVRDVIAQNKQIAENQAKIDEKLEKLAEIIHQARLFAARSGGRATK